MYDEYADVKRQNLEKDFDDNTYAKLQCYVYALRSPSDKRIFYVGKAGGKANQGNQRVLAHFDEAEEWLRTRNSEPSGKVRRISEAWLNEVPVEWFVVRHGLTEDVALDVEAALIDTLGISANQETSNIVRGHGAHTRGLLSAHDVAAIAATPVSPRSYKRVFVFQIQNAVDSGRSLKDAIVGNWKVAEAQQTVVDQPVAVGLLNGVSKIALQIDGWRMCPPDSGTYRFDGAPVEAEDLLNKSFVNIIAPALGFLQYGGGYVVVEFDGKSQFRFVRGYKDKTKWHPC